MPGFIHLRVHSAYSLSEGAIPIKRLAKLCREEGMPAVALTDTNNLFGALEFSVTLHDAGIQPIIGCQLNITRIDADGVSGRGRLEAASHPVVLLAQNVTGYGNLLALLARCYAADADWSRPQVSLDALCTHAEGLILLTGGPAGPLGQLLVQGREDMAVSALTRLRGAFRDRCYVELMRHGLEEEAILEGISLDLADRLELPVVATNDVFFATPDLYEAHDALLCIASGRSITDPDRRRVTPEHYFKPRAEMTALFSDLPDAVANTVLIARRCAFVIKPVKPMLPPFASDGGKSEAETLRGEAERGLSVRLAAGPGTIHVDSEAAEQTSQRYRERLDYELDVICRMGFAGYFLIVADFIRWAKERGIPVGPGRGSGAGSVVAWALTITDLDPIRFGLLFERFLNPERVSMPDFDIDFCQDRRDEVIEYVQGRYGADRVAQIITFGKLQARAVLRDVGRVLGMAYGHVDRICKLVPYNPANPLSLDAAIEAEPQLKTLAAGDESVAKLIEIARQLEGLYRHASTHAAGVVIADRPLEQLIPIYRDPRSSLLVTGFNMKWVETAGLVKFDFLGLKTLTVLARAVELVRAVRGTTLDLSRLPLDDQATYAMLGRGETVGVFQLESTGMRDVLRKLRPDTFEDIIAVVALYRPGPMDNIPSYIRRKHGDEQPDYLYPTLQPILRETYGIMIYQEQVMQIAQELSGYSLGSADLLRRAMGKKIQAEMDRQRETFVEGAKARGVAANTAAHIFDLVSKFAGYGFNKSHAAAYALVAYQTAYFKANYPLEFFAASMTLDLHNVDKLNVFRQELDRLGFRLLGPDVNASEVAFTVAAADDGDAAGIRYALAAVRNVGTAAVAAIVAERERGGPFTSLEDFTRRLDVRQTGKRSLENLVRAGALDGLHANRRQVFEAIEQIVRRATVAADDRESGQMGLFGDGSRAAADLILPEIGDWAPMDRLREELDAVGFYLSSHPLDAYGDKLNRLQVTPIAEVVGRGRSEVVKIAGTVLAKKERTSGRGSRYAFVQFSDTSGVFEVTVFSELLSQHRELFETGRSLLINANAVCDGDTMRLTATAIEALDQAIVRLPGRVEVFIDSSDPLGTIADLLRQAGAGRDRVRVVSWIEGGLEVAVELPSRHAVGPSTAARLRQITGVCEVREF